MRLWHGGFMVAWLLFYGVGCGACSRGSGSVSQDIGHGEVGDVEPEHRWDSGPGDHRQGASPYEDTREIGNWQEVGEPETRCETSGDQGSPGEPDDARSAPDSSGPSVCPCPRFLEPQEVGVVQHPDIREASGMAASVINPGVLWVHNDSGHPPHLFAMTVSGEVLGHYTLEGASALDWEGMSTGPGPDPGRFYLYIGDIGDNARRRSHIVVHRFPEPTLPSSCPETPFHEIITELDSFLLKYPDNKAYDAEALMVDPVDGTLIIVNKHLGLSLKSSVFTILLPQEPSPDVLTLEHLLDVSCPFVTAGDMSSDGRYLVLRNYHRAYLWIRPPGPDATPGSLRDLFQSPRCDLPLAAEPQGETLAFTRDISGYFTLSEGSNQPLYFHPRCWDGTDDPGPNG